MSRTRWGVRWKSGGLRLVECRTEDEAREWFVNRFSGHWGVRIDPADLEVIVVRKGEP